MASLMPEAETGWIVGVVVPLPSSPYWLSPQQSTQPSWSSEHV